MTVVDWLLLIVFGVPLAFHAGEFWRGSFDGAVLGIRRGVARLRSR